MKKLTGVAVVACALFFGPVMATAQSPSASDPAASSGSTTSASVATVPVEPASEQTDGVRFRGGIALSGGGEFASGFEVGMGGVEGCVGVQINNLIGLYVQPSLSVGVGRLRGVEGVTGTLGISALIDFTITDYFFAGIGGGAGILNNPFGPEIHFRVGGYPVVVVGEDGYSRQGLMLGIDARIFFLQNGPEMYPVTQILASVGYEVF
jgi:hypothetical protein